MTSNEASENIMRKIQSLLERAAHPSTPEHERQTSQEMADKLMAKYRLDRAMLNFKKTDLTREPTHREYGLIDLITKESTVSNKDYNEEWGIQSQVNWLRSSIYTHAGCRSTSRFQTFTVVGYEEDIFYGDMLWTTIFQDVITKMFPGWRKDVGFDENVFTLKNAGFSWPQVREMGLANEAADRIGMLTAENAGSKLRTGYKRHAKKIGYNPPAVQPRNPGLWRRSFVDSYSSQIQNRIRAMAAANAESAGKEGEIALIKDADRVRDFFYNLFPDLNPENWAKPEPIDPDAPKPKLRKSKPHKAREADIGAWMAGKAAADRVNLNQTKAAGHTKEAIQ